MSRLSHTPTELTEGTSTPAPRLSGESEQAAADLLFGLLLDVVRRRNPEIEAALLGVADVAGLTPERLARTLQAQGIWFQLLSIAEEVTGMRQRRVLEDRAGAERIEGTFARLLEDAAAAGLSAAQLRDRLAPIRVRPVLTAHPTEAKRVTVLEKHRRIYLLLKELESSRWTERERAQIVGEIRDEVELLWLTGELRLERPTVEQEIHWGLYFFEETLFDAAPELAASLARSVHRRYPDTHIECAPVLEFGTWIGGDCDGNPNVSATTIAQALRLNALAALHLHRRRLEQLQRTLSIAAHSRPAPRSFAEHLEAQLMLSGQGESIRQRNPGEPYRQFCALMLQRLHGALERLEGGGGPGQGPHYRGADELIADLRRMEQALTVSDCGTIAANRVAPARHAVETFRFCTARLDIRENSARINAALAALWRAREVGEAPPAPGSQAWREWLERQLDPRRSARELPPDLPPQALTVLGVFAELRRALELHGAEALGCILLSMTHSVADLLGVYLLARQCGLFVGSAGEEHCGVPIVPLFETIEDLRAAPAIMGELLAIPLVRRTAARHGAVHEVMLGYSDSNKDGGFLAANFELARAQIRLTELGEAAGLPIAFFHGRGGSVSRGGAPTGRAIAAQPTGSITRRFKVTEQGEVVSFKYANRGTALWQLELLTSSVLRHALHLDPPAQGQARDEHEGALERLAAAAQEAWRVLMAHPALPQYLQAASPLEEIALLNIGSRPARRSGARTLADLRAIPWVAAWSQNRHVITGWYGFGSALRGFLDAEGAAGARQLAAMYEGSRLFRLIVDEVEKTLMLVDLEIAQAYAELLPDIPAREEIFGMVAREYRLSLECVRTLTGESELGIRFPIYRGRLVRRLPIVDRVNREQVRLLRLFREADPETAADLKSAVLLSINCIAAALGATG